MADHNSFLFSHAVAGFGDYDDADELGHPGMNGAVPHDAVTETQYFGFSVPEERIHGMGYLWHHPRLGVVSGGVTAFQGIKHHHLAAEIYDQRMFMGDASIRDSLRHYRTDAGYQVDIDEPFRSMRVQYRDELRDNAIDVRYAAVAPPAMLPSRKHFEQPVRTVGSITLAGKTYRIDGFNVRDRSWGEIRSEEPMRIPPLAWLTGVFDDDFSFNALVMDDPGRAPDWAGLYRLEPGQALRAGWVRFQGSYSRIVEASQVTRRDPLHLHPVSRELTLTDDRGRHFELRGDIVASCPAGYWPNVSIHVGLMQWDCRGRTGWGDSQECQWGDFVRAMHKRA